MRFSISKAPLLNALLVLLFLAGCVQLPEQLTPSGVFDYEAWFAAIAPDGSLCEISLEGMPYTSLRTSGYRIMDEDISPDGRFYLMESGYLGYGTDTEVFVADLESGAINQLTDNRAFDEVPKWSPDGEWITYYYTGVSIGQDAGLYRMRRDGSDRELLVAGRVNAHDWSPDGSTLAYLQDGVIWRTYVTDLDARVPMVRSSRGMEWSPDGSMLVFVEKLDERDVINGQLSIYVVEDSETRTVLPLPSHIQYFIWSPDGEWIIFHGDLLGTDGYRYYDTYRIRPDGTGLEVLADCDV